MIIDKGWEVGCSYQERLVEEDLGAVLVRRAPLHQPPPTAPIMRQLLLHSYRRRHIRKEDNRACAP